MNVTMQKTGDESARLTVAVEENDYIDKVTSDLKEIGRQRVIPGFRKGHVPYSMLYRLFGQHVTSDVINNVVYDAVAAYLKDNNIDILGEPLPVEVKELDFKAQKDFTFEYDLILAPAVEIKLDKDIKVPYYSVIVTDDMIDEQDASLRKRFGSQVPGEETTPDSLIKGVLMQLNADGSINENEGAVQVNDAIVAPFNFKSTDEAAKFQAKKVGDKVVFNPWNSCEGAPAEMASMLHLDRSIAADIHNDFELTISEIIVVKPAELGEEFYTLLFGKDRVHNQEEYRAELKRMIQWEFQAPQEIRFRNNAHQVLLDKFGSQMKFADSLLKEWLKRRNKELNDENIDTEYERILPQLKWEIIGNRIVEAAGVQLTEDDVLNVAKGMARQQFAQYGMTNITDEIVENYAKQMASDKNYRDNLVNQASEHKLFDVIKGGITVESKEVSLEEYKSLS